MQKVLLVLLISLIFFGCAHESAFDRFGMSSEQERSEESIQSTKIMNEGESIGVLTAVYLNKTYPELFKDAEYFYIYLNIDADIENTEFILDGYPSLLVEELGSKNPYTKLTNFDAQWKRYYLVGFRKGGETLGLQVKNAQATSSIMRFKKE